MAKKQKRQVSQAATPAKNSASAPTSAFRRTITTSPTEFTPDYGYVISDLRRIGTLAGSFLAILIVLSFIIK
ncbi:MAG TPA: hypothetical protein VMT46_17620 [Anaerolineaceae bacterium]|nr:hypothetical protein [Anaerolineaceae bacterium]